MAIHQDSRVEPEYVSLREAARIYAVSTFTLRRRIASGDLPAVKLGKQDHPRPGLRSRRALPGHPHNEA